LSNLTVNPTEVKPNETATISVSVANTGGSEGNHDVVLIINGETEAKSVTLAAGDSEDVIFFVTRADAGLYTVHVANEPIKDMSGSFTVFLPVSIKIEANASSWREGGPHYIYGIIETKLSNAGIKVVSEASELYDAVLSVEYEETQGASYFGGGFGTNIHCSLELHDKIGNLLFERTISASTPSFVTLKQYETLDMKAWANFNDKVYFKYWLRPITGGNSIWPYPIPFCHLSQSF